MLLLQPVLQFFDNSGNVLNGGKLYFYVTSTTTPKDTYTTAAKSVANANPIILDSAGRPDSSGTPIDIFLDGTYKLVVKTSADVTIRTVDPVNTLGQLINTRSTSSSETIVIGDRDKLILVDASAGAKTITLLAAATCGDGFNVKIKKIDSSTNAVTIDGNASETIDGTTTILLRNQNDATSIITDGTSWYSDQSGTIAGNLYVGGTTTLVGNLSSTGTGSYTSAIEILGNSSNAGFLRVYENTTNGTNYIQLFAPTSIASNYNLVLPATTASVDVVLKNDGSGNLGYGALTATPATQAQQETGTSVVAAITPGTLKYHPNSPKTWCCVSLTTIQRGVNVASVTNPSTGTYTFTYTTGFSDAAGAIIATAMHATLKLYCVVSATSTSACTINVYDEGGVARDPTYVNMVVLGDFV